MNLFIRIPEATLVNMELCSRKAFESLPDGMKIKGKLSLFFNKQIKTLPDNLLVSDYLNASYSSIEEQPKGLVIGLNVSFAGCEKIKEFMHNIVVGESLSLVDTKIQKLREGLRINTSLFLNDCKNLMGLPQTLYVGERLQIQGCKLIFDIPEGVVADTIRYDKSTGFYQDKILLQKLRRRYLKSQTKFLYFERT